MSPRTGTQPFPRRSHSTGNTCSSRPLTALARIRDGTKRTSNATSRQYITESMPPGCQLFVFLPERGDTPGSRASGHCLDGGLSPRWTGPSARGRVIAGDSEPFLASLSLFQPPAFSVSVHGNSVPLPSSDPARGRTPATPHDGKFPGAKHQGSHSGTQGHTHQVSSYRFLFQTELHSCFIRPGPERLLPFPHPG